MRVLVIGGTGFLGHHVVAESASRGHAVSVLSRTPSPLGSGPRPGRLTGDAGRLTEDEWAALLDGHQGVVFAAGADDRSTPRRPAAAHFDAHNVAPVRRLLAAARRVGVERAVLHGSYFTAFHRRWPELRLADRHPYIASRVAQAARARAAAGPGLPVAVLEIPFVFGATPGRPPLLAPLVPWLRSGAPLPVPPGGTAVTTVGTVARATVDALESGSGDDLPIADGNLTWRQLVLELAAAAGRPTAPAVPRLPPAVLGAVLRAVGITHRLTGREGGLAPARLAGLLTRELFLEPTGDGDLTAALRDTVRASLAGASLRRAPGGGSSAVRG
ncbi:NAD(P)H-binding protein [Kitasatospora sp. RB6PN24]|uniref:NAD-dependent epimerase/dehydratase family protein n=1 Tax=Kitasatospora humi TaxID=2893891 RepID=UPI001E3A63C1|nr:NAD-dependent epimerase/dehydratase family protein [Kitasatospora humi]MCC9307429.1 NAD(P)H-binding protein [Kitasatospora humi]